ncbi:MarR family winged helix-turn-helix transcriptional regulator [Floricoccus tropicus]|nr:MarR family transcriptional regulator [Floricoccus tropicus]
MAKGFDYDINPNSVTAYLKLQWTFREVEKNYNKILEHFDLSESRFVIMMYLSRAEENQLLSSELAERLGVSKATISKILKKMEEKNLIEKIPSKTDKRSTYIKLTEEGLKKLKYFLPYNYKAVDQLFSNFSEKELENFAQLLEKLENNKEKLKIMENELNEQ